MKGSYKPFILLPFTKRFPISEWTQKFFLLTIVFSLDNNLKISS